MSSSSHVCRYFTSYTGVRLPLRLVNELDDESLDRRITYFKGYYDDSDRLTSLEKIVYGEIEFTHKYEYGPDERLSRAVLLEDDAEPRILLFDSNGNATEE